MPRKDPTGGNAPEKPPRARKPRRETPVDRKSFGYDPLMGLESIQTTMSGLLTELFARRSTADLPWEPPIDLFEEGRTLVVLVNLPGFQRDDVHLHAFESLLIVRGRSSEASLSEVAQLHVGERPRGVFHRAIPLPFAIRSEGITATLRDGVLRVVLPLEGKRPVRSVQIEID